MPPPDRAKVFLFNYRGFDLENLFQEAHYVCSPHGILTLCVKEPTNCPITFQMHIKHTLLGITYYVRTMDFQKAHKINCKDIA